MTLQAYAPGVGLHPADAWEGEAGPTAMGLARTVAAMLAVQAALAGWALLGEWGLHLPAVREVLWVLYLSFLPGLLLLRALRVEGLPALELFLYSVGLSVLFTMLLGLAVNTLYPVFGVARPISLAPLLATYSVAVPSLAALAYWRAPGYRLPFTLRLTGREALTALALVSLPLLAVLGTDANNASGNPAILLAMLGLTAAAMVLAALRIGIPAALYPWAVFTIALALFLPTSLAGTQIPEGDLRLAFAMANAVQTNGLWDAGAPVTSYNTVLSHTLWPAIYSIILGIDAKWVFQVLLPMASALMLVTVYEVFAKQAGTQVGLLAALFYASNRGFLVEMPLYGAQQMGLLFLALLLLVASNGRGAYPRMNTLLAAFLAGLTMSHWGSALLFVAIVGLARLVVLPFRQRGAVLTWPVLTLSAVMTASWFMFVGRSIVFDSTVFLGFRVADGLAFYVPFLQKIPTSSWVFEPMASVLREVSKWLNMAAMLTTGLGVLAAFALRRAMPLRAEFLVLGGVAFGFVSIVTASNLNANLSLIRMLAVNLVFIAPFFVWGTKAVEHGATWLLQSSRRLVRTRVTWLPRNYGNRLGFFSPSAPAALVIAALFLMNSGVILAIADDYPLPMALDRRTDYPIHSKQEEAAGTWTITHKWPDDVVYGDKYTLYMYLAYPGGQYGHGPGAREIMAFTVSPDGETEDGEAEKVPSGAIALLREYNIQSGRAYAWDLANLRKRVYVEVAGLGLANRGRVYDNGGARVYR